VTDVNESYDPPQSSSKVLIAILFGAIIALAAVSVYLFVQVDSMRSDVAKLRTAVLTEISNYRDATSMTSEANQKHLEALREQVETARRNAALAAGQAKKEALRHAEQLAKKLEEEQQRQQQLVKSELTEVKQATTTANAKIADVRSDVTNVRSEVAETKSELEKTIATLKSVTGDLGVQSGLIATNAKELTALRQLGDRNYFDFNLSKTKRPQKVGNIAIKLKKTKVKQNKFTIEVLADDKNVEKKDRAVNEPIQFYVAGVRQPYEIVVNEVRKDQIVGYLATPKFQAARQQ
jgi:chromosome segregation ATPase